LGRVGCESRILAIERAFKVGSVAIGNRKTQQFESVRRCCYCFYCNFCCWILLFRSAKLLASSRALELDNIVRLSMPLVVAKNQKPYVVVSILTTTKKHSKNTNSKFRKLQNVVARRYAGDECGASADSMAARSRIPELRTLRERFRLDTWSSSYVLLLVCCLVGWWLWFIDDILVVRLSSVWICGNLDVSFDVIVVQNKAEKKRCDRHRCATIVRRCATHCAIAAAQRPNASASSVGAR
jgi:hypothetical protein